MDSAIAKIPSQITTLLVNHAEDLKEAWANTASDESLTISFSTKISVKKGSGKGETCISFTKEKVKDQIDFDWDDRQMSIPLKDIMKKASKEFEAKMKSDGIECSVEFPEEKA